ncbi:mitochondrial amidoxime reducing component 2-like [Lycorma delicatula]|uniref:mitochondrial amidoxime reducing component 2-like n=1 Tax=Lycorma delicatula TaxID=130591 RepID=UPI003F516CCF
MGKFSLFTLTVTSVSITAGFILLYYKMYDVKRKKNKWRQVGKLTEIVIYPLKAGTGIFIDEAYCIDRGLVEKCNKKFIFGDRYFIAYDEQTGMRISCKNAPFITKICIVPMNDTSVELSAPAFQKFHLELPDISKNKVNCMIYPDIPSETIDCGDEVAIWLSNVLFKKNKGVRLGFFVRDKIKIREDSAGMLKDYKRLYPNIKKQDLGAYSFFASYLLINQSSLDDLNTQLPCDEEKVTSLNFRSNLTITGLKAYEEDNLKLVKIGEKVILKHIKPCTRCLVTTLNPKTAQFSRSSEPLKTLKRYRLLEDIEKNKAENWSPVFGQYFGLYEGGCIKIGDPIYALDY